MGNLFLLEVLTTFSDYFRLLKLVKYSWSYGPNEVCDNTDRKRAKVNEYKVGDLVILSTKDLKYQMVGRRTEKLTERFIGPYKIKKIVLLNTVELELLSTVKIHPVVNVSRIQRCIGQVERQRKEQPALVITEGKKECKVERILNKQQIQGKDKYLVQ